METGKSREGPMRAHALSSLQQRFTEGERHGTRAFWQQYLLVKGRRHSTLLIVLCVLDILQALQNEPGGNHYGLCFYWWGGGDLEARSYIWTTPAHMIPIQGPCSRSCRWGVVAVTGKRQRDNGVQCSCQVLLGLLARSGGRCGRHNDDEKETMRRNPDAVRPDPLGLFQGSWIRN